MKSARKIFLKLILTLIAVAGLLFCAYHFLTLNLPNIALLKDYNPSHTSFMESDKNFFDFGTPHVDKFVPYDKIPTTIVRAVLVAEDDTFFFHHGFDWDAITKAYKFNQKKKKYVRGASTITQQLARNLFLTRDKSILRKLKEAVLTIQLEQTLTKERILELYLNCIEFGPEVYGLYAGSEYHFKTGPQGLNSNQAALLAAVLPNPKIYGKKPYPNITLRRQEKVLARMARYDPLQPSKEKKKKDDQKVTPKPKQKTPQPQPLPEEELDQIEDLMDDEEESQFLDE